MLNQAIRGHLRQCIRTHATKKQTNKQTNKKPRISQIYTNLLTCTEARAHTCNLLTHGHAHLYRQTDVRTRARIQTLVRRWETATCFSRRPRRSTHPVHDKELPSLHKSSPDPSQERTKNRFFHIFKCLFRHPRDLKSKFVWGDYSLSKSCSLLGLCFANETVVFALLTCRSSSRGTLTTMNPLHFEDWCCLSSLWRTIKVGMVVRGMGLTKGRVG